MGSGKFAAHYFSRDGPSWAVVAHLSLIPALGSRGRYYLNLRPAWSTSKFHNSQGYIEEKPCPEKPKTYIHRKDLKMSKTEF